jgi:hypothetical protein
MFYNIPQRSIGPRNLQIVTEERVKGDLFSFSFVTTCSILEGLLHVFRYCIYTNTSGRWIINFRKWPTLQFTKKLICWGAFACLWGGQGPFSVKDRFWLGWEWRAQEQQRGGNRLVCGVVSARFIWIGHGWSKSRTSMSTNFETSRINLPMIFYSWRKTNCTQTLIYAVKCSRVSAPVHILRNICEATHMHTQLLLQQNAHFYY